eukprot:23534-Amphidinium_carterae.1
MREELNEPSASDASPKTEPLAAAAEDDRGPHAPRTRVTTSLGICALPEFMGIHHYVTIVE